MKINEYYNMVLTKLQIKSGEHRDAVGGMWDEIGKLQFDFLVAEGLKPDMRFIDIGCGSLRGGVHFINYLLPLNYYGIDANQSLLDAGYDFELGHTDLKSKLLRANLFCDIHFDFMSFNATFEYALAQSVFSHLPLNNIRLCLINLAKVMNDGGKFYATFFECSYELPIENCIHHKPGDVISHTDQDPYHYKISDFQYCIEGLPWELTYLGDWGHPRNQKMLKFTKTV